MSLVVKVLEKETPCSLRGEKEEMKKLRCLNIYCFEISLVRELLDWWWEKLNK